MPALALAARALTLFRFVAIAPYVAWLEPGAPPALAAFYVAVAASDFVDGRLARRANATSAAWGRADAAADIAFNTAALAAAAAGGFIGPWAPLAVAILGTGFLVRQRTASLETGETGDLPGKLAGVFFYALVGIVTLEAVRPGTLGGAIVRRLGDAVALYAAGVVSARFAMSSWRR